MRRHLIAGKGKFGCIVICFYFLLFLGYVLNIVKFVKYDFEAPYKAELIRGIGMVIPYGGIIGYFHIEDGGKE